MKQIAVTLATGAIIAVAPSVASAASLTIEPTKACYLAREHVSFHLEGFTPGGPVRFSRDDGAVYGDRVMDATGALRVGFQFSSVMGSERRTYIATDLTDTTLTASVPAVVSEFGVRLRPRNGRPGRRLRITARGFTTGETLWAHVRHRRSNRLVKVGRLKGACGNLTTHRRLLRRRAGLGRHTVQFDTHRRFVAKRPDSQIWTVDVRLKAAASAARATGWRPAG